MKVQSRVRRPVAGVVLAVVMASSVLTACQVAKAGAKCRTTDWGRDSGYVLQCRKGKWVRVMTFREYLLLVKRLQDAQTPPTPPPSGTPTPGVGTPVDAPWRLGGDITATSPDSAVDGIDDGIGYAAALIGDTAYVAGSFNTITNGTTSYGRTNIAAFNVTTGQPTGFVADTNGKVTSLATDGSKLFIGGTFTTVKGQPRSHFAVVDPGSGDPYGGNWVRDADDTVYDIAVSGSRVYVVGNFFNFGGVGRQRGASLLLSDGALGGFNPRATGGGIDSVAVTPDDSYVYIGGSYTELNHTPSTYLSQLDTTGAVTRAAFADMAAPALDIDVNAGGVLAAVGGNVGGDRVTRYNHDGTVSWTTSTFCAGDAQAVKLVNGGVLGGFHQSCQGDSSYHLVKLSEANGAVYTDFRPKFDGYWGVWDIAGNSNTVVVAGQFDHINGKPYRGFAIYHPAP